LTDIAIKVEGLSKLYKIGKLQRRHDTLRDRIADARVFNLFKRRNGNNGNSKFVLQSAIRNSSIAGTLVLRNRGCYPLMAKGTDFNATD